MRPDYTINIFKENDFCMHQGYMQYLCGLHTTQNILTKLGQCWSEAGVPSLSPW